jgi:hypothetical protein
MKSSITATVYCGRGFTTPDHSSDGGWASEAEMPQPHRRRSDPTSITRNTTRIGAPGPNRTKGTKTGECVAAGRGHVPTGSLSAIPSDTKTWRVGRLRDEFAGNL